MQEFSFDRKPFVKIQGKEYEFDPSNNDLMMGVMNDFPKIVAEAHKMQDLLSDMDWKDKAARETIMAENEKLMEDCQAFIIGCLGKKEYEEIFSQRRPNSTEHVRLCEFLFKTLISGRDKLLEEYLGEDAENAVGEIAADGSGANSTD